MPESHRLPPILSDSPVITTRQMLANFVPENMDYGHISATSTGAPTAHTRKVFRETVDNGVRFVLDPGLNSRLKEALDDAVPLHQLAPDDLAQTFSERQDSLAHKRHEEDEEDEDEETGDEHEGREEGERDEGGQYTIFNEPQLSARMGSVFWEFINFVTLSKIIPIRSCGFWRPSSVPESGAPDWVYVRKREKTVASFAELKLHTVLPAAKVQQLMTEAGKPGGMRIIMSEEEHWANAGSQLWEEFYMYKRASVVILSSYELFIPVQRDPFAPNVVRVGLPIGKTGPVTGYGVGKLTCAELAVACALPCIDPMPSTPFPPLPKLKPETGSTGASRKRLVSSSNIRTADIARQDLALYRKHQLQPPLQTQQQQQQIQQLQPPQLHIQPNQPQPPQPQPPQPQPPQPQQHQDRPLWERVDLFLQMAVVFFLSLSAICLAVGLWRDYKHPTVAGRALSSYAGSGLWIVGGLLSFPGVIAACIRGPGAGLAARRWLAAMMATLLLGMIDAVGNFVVSSRRHD
ncbi:hypothetical protein L198_08183 [Cryptococcus wingfieldii CBS 7118]|uniref:Uncharacterized protein n=1 Tax=Cryptococcus wingfieldii CBS 7118 TaxID=1295528 RepID=A0A1E3HF96_9TREE|nr:hypothetical protein L198_08183 [Cryptococcus wingfieldii CBS 7118]ODN74997.1 hypothetical protein L198_08183 [Cryptococcus wingfieldii CBS 7118]